ncbi:hypothetical protein Dimus_002697 [Dionaea muscipula]
MGSVVVGALHGLRSFLVGVNNWRASPVALPFSSCCDSGFIFTASFSLHAKRKEEGSALPLASGLGAAASDLGKLCPTDALADEENSLGNMEEAISHQEELAHSDSSMNGDDELQTIQEIDDDEGETLIPAAEIQIEGKIHDVDGETLILSSERDIVDAPPE